MSNVSRENLETKTCIAIVASLAALVVSIFCVCPTLPRVLSTEELNFDYLGLITGILSVLITLLIGWNIYTVFDFKSSITQASSNMNMSNFESYKCLAEVYNATSNIYSTLIDNIDISNNEKVVRMLFFRMHSLLYFCRIHDIENMEVILNGLNEDVKKARDNVILSYDNKDAFYDILSQLKTILTNKQCEQIKDFVKTAKTVSNDEYKNKYFSTKPNQT